MEELKKENTEKYENKNKQLYWIFGVMGAAIFVFFLTSFIYNTFFSTFDYEGLTFKKTFFGEIPLYQYSYNSIITGKIISTVPVNLILRHDPRENNVLVVGEKIEFPTNKSIYLGFNSTGLECPYTTLSVGTLSSFLASNNFKIQAGTVNPEESANQNLTLISCDLFKENAVIILQSGENTSVSIKNNCYTITASNCEVLQAVEKFEVQSIIDAKENSILN